MQKVAVINGQILGKYTVVLNSEVGFGTKIWNFVNIYDSVIGENCKIGSHVEIGGSKIGNHTKIEAFVFIPPGVTIGNHVFIGPGVHFANDKYPNADPVWQMGNITVEDNVKIGMDSTILPGVTIQKRSFVAAGSLVTKSIGSDVFAMGRPAHCVSKRIFDEVGLQ